jgi:nuclear pore complex protein Nup62
MTTTATSAPQTGGLLGAKPAADTAATTSTINATTNPLTASTAGPTSQLSRLKNKTMDDVITRWASDLSKYQKDFKEQATQVSEWDIALVSNGDKIQKLYLDTFEAERASHEIERQLQAVESQQNELEDWLDRYEKEVQEMFARQIGQGEQLSGPDQERERTYKLAEKLTQNLDERSRDLAKMVQEINDVSGTLSKSNKTDDPVGFYSHA